MKIPEIVEIGSYNIPVRYVDMIDEESSRGEYKRLLTEIWILKHMSMQQRKSVFIHECIEAINDVHDLNLTETQICTLEQEMTSIIKQIIEVNP